MIHFQKTPSPLVRIRSAPLTTAGIQLFLKRDDLIDPDISGNKWRKLKYNLIEARKQGKNTLVSFGGAYSNHLYALAAAGKKFGFKTVALVRGEQAAEPGATLQFAKANGTILHFCSRDAYRDPDYKRAFAKTFLPDAYIIPEGGSNSAAIRGCIEIMDELNDQLPESPDFVCVSAGTGGTAAGIIAGSHPQTQVLVFPALKGQWMGKEINELLSAFNNHQYHNWALNTTYHFGGYAKFKPALIRFIQDFQVGYGIPLEPVYTGKLLYGVFDLIRQNYFPKGSTIVAIHTGGLQGIEGYNERFGESLGRL